MITGAEGGLNGRELSSRRAPGGGAAVRVRRRAPEKPDIVLPEVDVRLARDRAAWGRWAQAVRDASGLLLVVVLDLVVGSLAIAHALVVAGLLAGEAGFDPAAASLLLFLQPLALGLCGAYSSAAHRVPVGRLVGGTALTALLAWLYQRLPGTGPVIAGGAFLPAYAVGAAVLVPMGRLVFDPVIRFARRPRIRRVLAFGAPGHAAVVERLLVSRRGRDFRVVGRLAPAGVADDGAQGALAEVDRVLRETGAHGVAVPSTLPSEMLETAVRRCLDAGATVFVAPPVRLPRNSRLIVRETATGAVLEVQPRGARIPQFAIKRAMDVVLSLIALALLAPLMLLIAVAIKLDSPGPVLFKQVRAGLGGRPFAMFKFRTMVCGADEMKQQLQHLNSSGDPRLFKIPRDPRVTRVGKLLRRTSLDELPQLFNVLRGEMSLVGPRPFFPEDLALYEPHHFERLSVLPGITGLWQVSGRSDVTDFEEVVRLDWQYIRNWSLWLDLWILLRTIPAAFGRRGAY